jgi:phosphoribosylformylglycinamidine (FGAM) synthase PurS component
MEKFNVTVEVNLKPEIKDVKALTLKQAVEGILAVNNFDCRVGSVYNLSFEARDKTEACAIVDRIAQEILANGVIEEYEVRS